APSAPRLPTRALFLLLVLFLFLFVGLVALRGGPPRRTRVLFRLGLLGWLGLLRLRASRLSRLLRLDDHARRQLTFFHQDGRLRLFLDWRITLGPPSGHCRQAAVCALKLGPALHPGPPGRIVRKLCKSGLLRFQRCASADGYRESATHQSLPETGEL